MMRKLVVSFFIATTTFSSLCLGENGIINDFISSEQEIHIINKCNHPIVVAIHYKDSREGWTTKGWLSVPPGRLGEFRGSHVFYDQDSVLYFTAKTVDHSGLVWEGDYQRDWGLQTLKMKKITYNPSREKLFDLHCDNQ